MKYVPDWGIWLLALLAAVSILLAAGSSIFALHTRNVHQQAHTVLDSLGAIQCRPVR